MGGQNTPTPNNAWWRICDSIMMAQDPLLARRLLASLSCVETRLKWQLFTTLPDTAQERVSQRTDIQMWSGRIPRWQPASTAARSPRACPPGKWHDCGTFSPRLLRKRKGPLPSTRPPPKRRATEYSSAVFLHPRRTRQFRTAGCRHQFDQQKPTLDEKATVKAAARKHFL